MKTISHQQAKKWIFAALDDLLRPQESARLEAHLRECSNCRNLAAAYGNLETRLKNNPPAVAAQLPASRPERIAQLHKQARRSTMFRHLTSAARLTAASILTIFSTLLLSLFFAALRQSNQPAAPNTTRASAAGQILFVRQLTPERGVIAKIDVDGQRVENLITNTSDFTDSTDYAPAWSPDGSKIAFLRRSSEQETLFVMDANGAHLTALSDLPGCAGPFFWSPDSAQIAYFSGANCATLMALNADGSQKRPLLETSQPFIVWSPDSRQIAAFGADELILLQADGATQRLPFAGKLPEQLRWLDERFLAGVAVQTGETPLWTLYRFDSQTNTAEALAASSTPISAWFWDGERLTYLVKSWNSLAWYALNGEMLNVWHNFAEKCEQYPRDLYIGAPALSPTPDGLRALASVNCGEGKTWLYLINADGSQIAPLISEPLAAWPNAGGISVAWSPDGRRLVLLAVTGETSSVMYLLDVAQSLESPATPPQILISENSLRYDPAWQPAP